VRDASPFYNIHIYHKRKCSKSKHDLLFKLCNCGANFLNYTLSLMYQDEPIGNFRYIAFQDM
jgi:hypothetical protein